MVGFKILLWLSEPEKFSGPSRNVPQDSHPEPFESTLPTIASTMLPQSLVARIFHVPSF